MVITLEDVSKSYGIDVIIAGVNSSVNYQDRIGIIGENGAGKTTLLSMIMGVLENDTGKIILGDNVTIGYLKQMEKLTDENTIYKEMESVFSNVFLAQKRMQEIEKLLIEDSHNQDLIKEHHDLENLIHSKDGYNIDFYIKKMLNGMGFNQNEWDKKVGVLSGGEQTRLNLAKLLLENPDILILDEPTNHLDFDTLVWLEDYLINYKGSVITVSHDRFFLDKICNRIWELEDTEFFEYKGNYSAFEIQKEEKLKLQQKMYEQDLEKALKLQEYVDKNLVRASTSNMAKSRRKTLEKMEMTKKPRSPRVPLKFKFTVESQPYEEVLQTENLTISAGTKDLLKDFNLDLRRGERLIIAGSNGTGKTTLIKTLYGKHRPLSGRVKIGNGVKMSVYDQHVAVSSTSVMENIWGLRPKWTEFEVRSYLAKFGYRNDEVFKGAMGLSGGEKARLRFCQISLDKSNLLFVDEPTNHLDIYMRAAVTEALSSYEGTLIVVTHDRYLMQQLSCPIMNIENQTAVFYEDFNSFMDKKSIGSFFGKTKIEQEKPKTQNINQKEQRKKAAQDRLKIKECERRMEELQIIIDRCENDMQNPEITTDPVKMQNLWKELEKAKLENEEQFDIWAQLSEALESE